MGNADHEGEMQAGSYDHFTAEQFCWYEWAVKGICEENGRLVPSSVYMHIPVPEYRDAWASVIDTENRRIKAPYDSQAYCRVCESIGAPQFQNSFSFH